ncbi:MAG: class I SAM-dependent methyltransferase [Acidimicrobiales bacterium]
MSLELIEVLGVPTDAGVIDIGGGASLFVDHVVGLGFRDVTVLDVSETALRAAGGRLGPAAASWLHEDVLSWKPERLFDLWHDRAVFHFLVDSSDRDKYLATLRAAVSPGGALVIGTFAADGPEHCSGRPVARYSSDDLADVLGDAFEVIATRREQHTTPSGSMQPFTWVAARASEPGLQGPVLDR